MIDISSRTYRYINRSYKRDLEYYNNLLTRKKFELGALKDDNSRWQISYDIIKCLYNELYNSHQFISQTNEELQKENEELEKKNEELKKENEELKKEIENEKLLKEIFNTNLNADIC